jgi:tellurite resistance protein
MKLTMQERSECFRGFLLLIAQDRVIAPEEKEVLCRIGKALDFEQGFCEESIDDLLENAHIATHPPVFSRREYAEAFLCDCIHIAGADKEIHPNELLWLNRIAEANGIPETWLEEQLKDYARQNAEEETRRMEIEAYI